MFFNRLNRFKQSRSIQTSPFANPQAESVRRKVLCTSMVGAALLQYHIYSRLSSTLRASPLTTDTIVVMKRKIWNTLCSAGDVRCTLRTTFNNNLTLLSLIIITIGESEVIWYSYLLAKYRPNVPNDDNFSPFSAPILHRVLGKNLFQLYYV